MTNHPTSPSERNNDMSDPVTEWLVLAPAWQSLSEYLCTREEHAMTIDPRELAKRIREMGDRAAALLYVHMHAD